MTRLLPRLSIVTVVLVLTAGVARADDTRTLPAGIGRVHVRPVYSLIRDRWNQDGDSESVTHDLDGRNLNSEVFPDLSILERIYGSRAGALTLGTSRVDSGVSVFAIAIAAEVGLTDRLTVGAGLPLVHARHGLSSLELEPETGCDARRCGMARNPGDTNIDVEDSKYLPLDHDKDPGTRFAKPLEKEDVQNILVEDLDYARLEDWSGTGIGDLELGAKLRVLEWGLWSTAIQAGVRLPTGRADDINNLLDLGFGDGQTDIGLYWQNDFAIAEGLFVNATLRYTVQLPDHELKRVPPSADVPLAKKEAIEDVWRDLGDIFQAELMLAWSASKVLTPFLRYAATFKAEDEIRGNRGLSYQALMDETALRNHGVEAGVSFSTVPWVVEQSFWLPIDVTLSFERSLAGKNNAPIGNVISLDLAAYFEVVKQ